MRHFKNYILPVSLILILSFSRIIPHPWNFTPVLAVGIFSGFYFKQFFVSFFIVIVAMFLGDLYLGFHSTMFFTYVSLAIAVGFGLYVKNFKLNEILWSGLASSAGFFLVTNFGVWITLEMYEKNLAGLVNAYVMAIPFFHNTLISTLLYLFLIKVISETILNKNNLLEKI